MSDDKGINNGTVASGGAPTGGYQNGGFAAPPVYQQNPIHTQQFVNTTQQFNYPQPEPGYNGANPDGCCMPMATTDTDEQESEMYKFRPHIKTSFDDIFREPNGCQSFEFAANYNRAIFYWSQRGLYAFLTTILGPILVFALGITFSMFNFMVIWLMSPTIKMTHVIIRSVESLMTPTTQLLIGPLFRAMGEIYRNRNAGPFTPRTYDFNVKGDVAAATDVEAQVRGHTE